jgi:hypothetical protein
MDEHFLPKLILLYTDLLLIASILIADLSDWRKRIRSVFISLIWLSFEFYRVVTEALFVVEG